MYFTYYMIYLIKSYNNYNYINNDIDDHFNNHFLNNNKY